LPPPDAPIDDCLDCGEEGNVNDAPKLPLEVDQAAYNEGIDKSRMRPFQPELCPNNLYNPPPLLKEVCEKLDFDIAEMWLRVDASKHRLVHYHVSDVLDQSVRRQVMNVYQGVAAQRMKHRLSAAMCKLTKETKNVSKITTQSPSGAQALQSGLVSGISVALAVPICHEGINMTILTFCVNRSSMESQLDGSLEEKGKEIEEIAHAMTGRSKRGRSLSMGVDVMGCERLSRRNCCKAEQEHCSIACIWGWLESILQA